MAKIAKTRKPFIPTQAYFDPAAATLTVVTPTNITLLSRPVPADVVSAAREEQEQWVREAVTAAGRRARGRAKEYPYGFLFNV